MSSMVFPRGRLEGGLASGEDSVCACGKSGKCIELDESQVANLQKAVLHSFQLEQSISLGDAKTSYALISESLLRLGEIYPSIKKTGILELPTEVPGLNGKGRDGEKKRGDERGDPPTTPLEKLQERTQSGSRYTNCPVCGKCVAIYLINDHLDRACSSFAPLPYPSPKRRDPRDSQSTCIPPKTPKAFKHSPDPKSRYSESSSSVSISANSPKDPNQSPNPAPAPALKESRECREARVDRRHSEGKRSAGDLLENGGYREISDCKWVWKSQSFPPAVWGPAYYYFRDGLRGAMMLERERRYSDSARVLNYLSKVPRSATGSQLAYKARYRLVQDLIHIKRQGLANKILTEALTHNPPFLGSFREGLRRLSRRCKPRGSPEEKARNPKLKQTGTADIGGPTEGGVPVVEAKRAVKGTQVETFALQWYKERGWHGWHTENGPFLTLYMLLFWDCHFHPLARGCAHHADVSLELLFPSTASQDHWKRIESQLDLIKSGKGTEILIDIWTKHHGKQAYGVNWEVLGGLEGLIKLANGICGRALSIICLHFSIDFQAHLGGLPDLILFQEGNDPSKSSKVLKIKLSEVKGPGDSLSDRQRSWLAILKDAGVHVEVLRVVDC
uniref:Fanconi-associated nuclease n=1 Tax=Amorphochlora amoebiformis TaxID=1561963 RepID=A0A7S0DQT3_9EUKA